MWYFAWLLGLPLAAMFAVVNAMWLELQEDSRMINDQGHNEERLVERVADCSAITKNCQGAVSSWCPDVFTPR